LHKKESEPQATSIIEEKMRFNYPGAAYRTCYSLPHLNKSRGRMVRNEDYQ
jgi:hypothetical protein